MGGRIGTGRIDHLVENHGPGIEIEPDQMVAGDRHCRLVRHHEDLRTSDIYDRSRGDPDRRADVTARERGRIHRCGQVVGPQDRSGVGGKGIDRVIFGGGKDTAGRLERLTVELTVECSAMTKPGWPARTSLPKRPHRCGAGSGRRWSSRRLPPPSVPPPTDRWTHWPRRTPPAPRTGPPPPVPRPWWTGTGSGPPCGGASTPFYPTQRWFRHCHRSQVPGQILSMMVPVARAPPQHMEISASCLSVRSSS